MDSQFEEADALSASVQNIKPDTSELEAIKAFCEAELKKRTVLAESSAALKTLRQKQKDIRTKLTNELGALNVKCAMISKADAARFETSALPPMPPYVRLVSSNKDAAITHEVIQEAIEAVTEADLKETKATEASVAMRTVILQNIRRIIRTYTEALKLVTSLQRGLTVYDVPEVPSAMADTMMALWTTEHEIKNFLAFKKVDPEPDAAKHKERVEAFFIRTGLQAQRIVLEGTPYRIVRRISVRKPKIALGIIEKMLEEIIKANAKPTDIVREMQTQIANLPPDTKSTVSLCAVKAKAP